MFRFFACWFLFDEELVQHYERDVASVKPNHEVPVEFSSFSFRQFVQGRNNGGLGDFWRASLPANSLCALPILLRRYHLCRHHPSRTFSD